jgi:undecaprenyl diphosphate synthase
MPDPDLVIRTSGETRVSNFLLMQAAYAEFVLHARPLARLREGGPRGRDREYSRRERRYGMTSEQLKPQEAGK